MQRRRFLETAWGGALVFGSGLVGLPLCGCDAGGGAGTGPARRGDLGPLDLADLPELDDAGARRFLDQAQRDAASLGDEGPADAGGRGDLGPPRLPPGQRAVRAWPVLGQNRAPRAVAEWSLRVSGAVERELTLDWAAFAALPHVQRQVDIHCVTGWTLLDSIWRGVPVAELLDRAGVLPGARFVVFDCEHGYTTNLDLATARHPDVLVADQVFDEPLAVEHGGLARGLVPMRYFYKSGKWLTGLRVLEEDEPGYWEVRGYSNTADPWTEDRYSTPRPR